MQDGTDDGKHDVTAWTKSWKYAACRIGYQA